MLIHTLQRMKNEGEKASCLPNTQLRPWGRKVMNQSFYQLTLISSFLKGRESGQNKVLFKKKNDSLSDFATLVNGQDIDCVF